MTIRAKVVLAWQQLTRRERQTIRHKSIRSGIAVYRFRCKIIMALVQGKTPSQLVAGGLCSASQVYRTAHLFLEQGLRGMADKREDNGEHKFDARYESELLTVVAGSPQEHGYLRPTWTQELLILVLAEKTGVTISVTTMSRLLKAFGSAWVGPNRSWNAPGRRLERSGNCGESADSSATRPRMRSWSTSTRWTSI